MPLSIPLASSMQRRSSAAVSTLYGRLRGSHLWFFVERLVASLVLCVSALGGCVIGAITGAIRGNTTETGVLRGFGVGAVAGAITGVQLLDLISSGEPFSKVALIRSLINGKIFMEWMTPAMLKTHHWQATTMDPSLMEIPDIFFEVNTVSVRGMCQDSINKLPIYVFSSNTETRPTSCSETTCAICLQDLEDGDHARLLTSCRHFFHRQCIDKWLVQQAMCPVCRKDA